VRRPVFWPLLLAAACSHAPPADFAPEPGLVDRIKEIRLTAPPQVCPGETFGVTYAAVLEDGAIVPFESRYDKKHPPRLHVVFLDRSSDEATPLENGAWAATRDPFATITSGFHLAATLKQKPSLRATATVDPEYSCMPHAFSFQGVSGDRGSAGGDGPDVTVRLGIVRSPHIERLLVASIAVGDAPPFFTVADANVVPPRDWLVIETRGGKGGRGIKGQNGSAGAAGQPGCAAGDGAPGQAGGRGGVGGPGGRGGRITIIVPTEVPFLAGLVDARTPGGPGGDGGLGGDGGAGGAGGRPRTGDGNNCSNGKNGPAGTKGDAGGAGGQGTQGPHPQVITVSGRDVFGPQVPPGLADLLGAAGPNRRP